SLVRCSATEERNRMSNERNLLQFIRRFCGLAERRAASRARTRLGTFRPQVFQLEDRWVPSKLTTMTAIATSISTPVYGQSVTLTATVQSNKGTANGTVTFMD